MKKLTSIVLIMILALSAIPAFAADQDIVEIAVDNGSFTILVAALQEADLVGALQGEGPFTVFAPTDDAFAALLEALDISAEQLLAQPGLADVLLYHVVSGKVMSTDLSDGMMAPTLNGESITVDLSMGVKINDSSVAIADIEATNGVIHVIDQVLVPSNFELVIEDMMMEENDIVDIALGNEDFSMLVALLQQADLVGALQGEGPFTVFAPTNDAFADLLAALDISAADLLAQPALADVLLYHVVSGKVMSGDLSDGLMAPTLNGESIAFDLSDGVKVNMSNVISADIVASNGVVHVVDSVLVPGNFVLADMMDDEEIPKTNDIGLLPYALLSVIGLAGYKSFKRK